MRGGQVLNCEKRNSSQGVSARLPPNSTSSSASSRLRRSSPPQSPGACCRASHRQFSLPGRTMVLPARRTTARCFQADDIGEHNRQRDLLAAGPVLEALRARLAFGRHDERVEIPLPVGGFVHRLDCRLEVNPLLWLGQRHRPAAGTVEIAALTANHANHAKGKRNGDKDLSALGMKTLPASPPLSRIWRIPRFDLLRTRAETARTCRPPWR
jgi:hypothetical protein